MLDVGGALFERQGYDDTTVREIAAAAGVTEMTFFRHFSTKESLLLDDPYDPMLVEAIGGQPIGLLPFTRGLRGVPSTSSTEQPDDGGHVMLGVRAM
ncbi:helix-turn-helix domain-containing protein [Microbacterium sp. B2969]|uniref:Helix-turn-helix domain-containing protein n=1 Tax=Microbacterium alkaliflavum TaxID=3248839 RepID=A0ABW7Q5V3_9MICO